VALAQGAFLAVGDQGLILRSLPVALSFSGHKGGSAVPVLLLSFSGGIGKTYTLEASTDLKSWQTAKTWNELTVYGSLGFAAPYKASQMFYRVTVSE
jgi:hypothetical protein